MTPEEQRICIAKACGFIIASDSYGMVEPDVKCVGQLPDYLNDLNACQSAVASMPKPFQDRFDSEFIELAAIRGKDYWQMSAQDWCECFILCLESEL